MKAKHIALALALASAVFAGCEKDYRTNGNRITSIKIAERSDVDRVSIEWKDDRPVSIKEGDDRKRITWTANKATVSERGDSPSEYILENGLVKTIVDYDENISDVDTYTLTYNAGKIATSTSDRNRRTMNFTWDGDKLVKMSDGTREITFSYSGKKARYAMAVYFATMDDVLGDLELPLLVPELFGLGSDEIPDAATIGAGIAIPFETTIENGKVVKMKVQGETITYSW